MSYEGIVLELMSRIQRLEALYEELHHIVMQQMPSADGSAAAEPRPDSPDANTTPPPTASPSLSPDRGRQKMTADKIDACYACGRELYENPARGLVDAAEALATQIGMNRNSAIMYIYAVKHMMQGEIYKRAISQPAAEAFFQYILRDFGEAGLRKAIQSTRLHIAYRRACGHTVDKLEALCDRYAAGLPAAP